jgi:hypothetical protein
MFILFSTLWMFTANIMPKLINIYRIIASIFHANKNCCKTGQSVAKPNNCVITFKRSNIFYSYRNDSIGSFSEARLAGE